MFLPINYKREAAAHQLECVEIETEELMAKWIFYGNKLSWKGLTEGMQNLV